MFRIYLRDYEQRVSEKTNTGNPQAALAAFAALVSRSELDGQKLAAVMTHNSRQLAFHRFDRLPGDSHYWRDKLDKIDWSSTGFPGETEGGKHILVFLDEQDLATASRLGNSNVSNGIREALRRVQ